MTQVRATIAESLRKAAREFNETTVPPIAVVWVDPDREWESVVGQIQAAVPVLRLGEYDPAIAQGPALWLRTVLAGDTSTLPDTVATKDERNPWVIYLPGVTKREFNAPADLDKALQPLTDIVLRAAWWDQPTNHNPWSPHAFVGSKYGTGLRLAGDKATRKAFANVLELLLSENLEDLLKQGTLDAGRLNALALPDDKKTMLRWIGDPEATKAAMTLAQWDAFTSTARSAYGINPESDTPITAAGKLGARSGSWALVWERFADNPAAFPGVPAALDLARPTDGALSLFPSNAPHPDSWPSWNQEQETTLRGELAGLAASGDSAKARRGVRELSMAHAARTHSVWAELDQAPLAVAVSRLAELGALTAEQPGCRSVEEFGQWYAVAGYRADELVIELLAAPATSADQKATLGVMRAIYDPWADDLAREFQTAAIHDYPGQVGLPIEPGTCVMYVDALRYDLAVRLAERISDLDLNLSHRIAAFPTVTPTGQPAVAPVRPEIRERWGAGSGFDVADTGSRAVKHEVLRQALADSGVEYLDWNGLGIADPNDTAWTQTNVIDEFGHTGTATPSSFANHAIREIALIADRIRHLFDAGWRQVVVVTDHGFLLPAAPAAKVELPLHLTEGDTSRKARVARLKAHATLDAGFPLVPWTWDQQVMMASAPGTASFFKNTEYEHGGLSPQECVIPVLTVTGGGGVGTGPLAKIDGIKWTGQRCRIDITPTTAPVSAELRRAAGDSASSITDTKPNKDGEVKLMVDEDDAGIGAPCYVVLLADDGAVIAQQLTTVGGL